MPPLAHAQAGTASHTRLALIIGNSKYEHVPSLKNAENDAALIASSLRNLDFEVIEKTDLDRKGFEAAIAETLAQAQGKSAILFYFAGHGFQLAGRNFLVPTDAKLSDRTRIPEETVSLDEVIGRMQDRDRQTLILLDACRNNPIPKSAASGDISDGLAQIETGSGTFVAFATQPGNITNDGAGANSPFSLALAEHIPTEGISISDMMIRVRNSVESSTFRKQTPWDQSSLRAQFYFNPAVEDSDTLTEEDMALLEKLDPALREKFLKKFNLTFGNDEEGVSQPEQIANVAPALRIEAADDPEPQNLVAELTDNAQRSTGPVAAPDAEIAAIPETAATPSEPPPAEEPAVVAALEPEVLKPGLMILGAGVEPAQPDTGAEPVADENSSSEAADQPVAIPIPQWRPTLEPEVEVAAISPAPPMRPALSSRSIADRMPEFKPPGELTGAPAIVISPAVGEAASEPEPQIEVAAILPIPVTRPALSARDVLHRMPEFAPAIELAGAPDTVQEAADSSPKDLVSAGEALSGSGSAPALTPTPSPEQQPAVELASLDLEKTAPLEQESQPESPLPDPVPVINTEELRRTMAINAQRELQRLGCYRSTIDGDWGPKSARALLRYYAEREITPDETEPTESLVSMLAAETTVVCKTTVIDNSKKAAPADRNKGATTKAPVSRKKPTATKSVGAKSAAPKKSQKSASASAAPPKAKKLTGGNVLGVFR